MANLYEAFDRSAARHSGRRAVGFLEGGRIVYWTYRELNEKILSFAAGLERLGLKPSDKVAFISANHPLWPVVDLAIARQGLVLVPIHTVLTAQQILKILRQSGAKALILGPGLDDKISQILPELPEEISTVIRLLPSLSLAGLKAGTNVVSFPDMQAAGAPIPAPAPVADADIATIIFTSGTTGEMKGVLLTHGGLVASALEGNPLVGASQHEELLSVLPLSHAFERTAGLLGPLFIGALVNYGRGLMELSEDIQVFQPNRVNAVPRLLEKIESGIQAKIQKTSPRMAPIFRSSLERSVNYRKLRAAGSPKAWWHALPHRLADLIFYRKIRKKLGGRLRGIICGGAPLDPAIAWFFEAIGVQVLQGYGLTEVSPIVSVNPHWKNKVGTVGLPLDCLQVRLGDKEEILVKGSSLMKGYDSEAATREAIDAEGWFHTGDQGAIDDEGYLTVKGRVKELIVTSYGKNVIPTLVEQAIEKCSYVANAAVFGHGKAYLSALIVPARDALSAAFPEEAKAKSWPEFCNDPKVKALMEKEIKAAQKDLASYEQIKKIQIIPEEFTQDNDMLTPTLKLKRRKIEERYQKEIASLYKEAL